MGSEHRTALHCASPAAEITRVRWFSGFVAPESDEGEYYAQPGDLVDTVGKTTTDRQYKKFSSTDDGCFCTVGTQALKCVSTVDTQNDPIATEIWY